MVVVLKVFHPFFYFIKKIVYKKALIEIKINFESVLLVILSEIDIG